MYVFMPCFEARQEFPRAVGKTLTADGGMSLLWRI